MGRVFRFGQRVVFCVASSPWLGLSILAVLTLSSALLGQTSQDSQAVVHLPSDWSHHHLVFSNPATEEQLQRAQQDPRYGQQLLRRSHGTRPEAELGVALASELPDSEITHASKIHKLKRDWSVNMGTNATVGAGQYPGFVVGSSSCSDFVAYNTSLAGASNQASIIAYNNVYSGCGTTIPSVYWAYNTNGGTISTSVTLSEDGTQLAFVQAQDGVATLVLLKWLQNASSTAASPAQLTIATSGISVSCNLTNDSPTINCPGANFTAAFDVGATVTGNHIPGGATITAVTSPTSITISENANKTSSVTLTITPQNTTAVAASGCSWNGTTNSTVTCTSGGFASADVGAVLVLDDGFPANETITAVNSSTNVTVSPTLGGGSSGSGANGSIYAHSLVSPSNYRSCAAPCMTSITFATKGTDTTPTDSYSAPFYDFSGTDNLYVGDDAGYLHQFTGVFAGTPAETTATWPVLTATAKLSSPVYDSTTGEVYVAAFFNTTNNGGRIHAVCANATCGGIGTTVASGILGPDTTDNGCRGTSGSGNGSDLLLDAPIVDPVAGMLYAFLGNDGNGHSAVIQLPTNFAANSCGNEAIIGTGGSGIPVFAGTFDNLYFNSSGSSPSGNLYVCGNASGAPALYQVPINKNAIAASGNTVLAALSTASSICSPVTEAYDGTNDWVFLSVESNSNTASPVNCPTTTGCLMNFSVPTTSGGALPTRTAVTPLWASGGSSGIVADTPVGSEIYYSELGTRACKTGGTGGCAVQVSQSGLD